VEYKTLARRSQWNRQENRESRVLRLRLPALRRFRPADAWVKKQGDNIVFKRMHISRPGTDLPQEKMFFTLEAMGLLTPELHTKAFNEIHVNHNRLNRDEHGVRLHRQAGSTSRSSSTPTAASAWPAACASRSMMDAYNVDSWPLIVDGKYITSPTMATKAQAASSKPSCTRRRRCWTSWSPRPRQRRSKHDAFARLHHRRFQRHRRRTGCQYAAQGATLGLLARRGEVLAALIATCPTRTAPRLCGRCARPCRHQRAAQAFLAHAGGIDVVIANAGISVGTLTEYAEDIPVFADVIATNVVATAATFAPFIAAMRAAHAGRLVGIGSVAGIRGLPGAEAYSASKAAVISYCESLRLE
jgi:hypothetical protein